MSTNSAIGIKREDGTVHAIYCHSDGYPEGVGAVLQQHYNTPERIEELLSLGSLSSLGAKIAPEPGEAHTFENRAEDVTTAYHRDRGDDLSAGITYKDEKEYIKEGIEHFGAEFMYMFTCGEWLFTDDRDDREFLLLCNTIKPEKVEPEKVEIKEPASGLDGTLLTFLYTNNKSPCGQYRAVDCKIYRQDKTSLRVFLANGGASGNNGSRTNAATCALLGFITNNFNDELQKLRSAHHVGLLTWEENISNRKSGETLDQVISWTDTAEILRAVGYTLEFVPSPTPRQDACILRAI